MYNKIDHTNSHSYDQSQFSISKDITVQTTFYACELDHGCITFGQLNRKVNVHMLEAPLGINHF
jgi:hypothetical protein